MRKAVRIKMPGGWLWAGLLAAAVCGYAQQEAPKPAATETPATTEAPAAPTTPASTPPAPVTTTPRPAARVERNTGDARFSFELDGWRPMPFRNMVRTGKTNENQQPSDLNFPKLTSYMPSGMLSIPVGRNNTLRFSYFQGQRTGNTTAPVDLNLFGIAYTAGTPLITTYRIRSAKISFDYLTWPFPVASHKFRLKTLWQVQYTTIKASGEGMSVAEDGTPTILYGDAAHSFFFPTFGLATEYAPSRSFRWELSGSGFAFPGRSATADAHTAAAIRIGRFEALFGAKFFYFKTSPKPSEYLKATMTGPFVGIRFYP